MRYPRPLLLRCAPSFFNLAGRETFPGLVRSFFLFLPPLSNVSTQSSGLESSAEFFFPPFRRGGSIVAVDCAYLVVRRPTVRPSASVPCRRSIKLNFIGPSLFCLPACSHFSRLSVSQSVSLDSRARPPGFVKPLRIGGPGERERERVHEADRIQCRRRWPRRRRPRLSQRIELEGRRDLALYL